MNVRTFYYILLLLPSVVLAQRQMVVVNLESKVPVRDVKISTDGGQELRTSWDGLFELPDSFRRLDFHHPDFERRYVLSSELKGDTIFLIPNVWLLPPGCMKTSTARNVKSALLGRRRLTKSASRRMPSKSGGIRLKRSDRLSETALLSIAGTSALVLRTRGVEVIA